MEWRERFADGWNFEMLGMSLHSPLGLKVYVANWISFESPFMRDALIEVELFNLS